MRRIAVLVAFAVITVLVVWRIGGDDDSQPDTTIATTTTAAPLPPTTVPQQEPFATLASVLLPGIDGYRINTGAKATGSLDLNAAVAAETDTQQERSLLETRHYEAGYGRAFNGNDKSVYMVVYDFASPSDASFYLTDGFITLYGKGASTYDVAGMPGAKGFSQGTTEDGRPAVVHGVAFAKADRFVLVFTRSASTATPEEATQLATALYARA